MVQVGDKLEAWQYTDKNNELKNNNKKLWTRKNKFCLREQSKQEKSY